MAALVSPAQMSALRAVGNRGLTQTALVTRQTQVESDFGSTEEWTEVGSFLCWIRELSLANSIIDVSMREAIVMIFRVHFEFGTDVQPADRLTVDGIVFDVIDDNAENTLQIFRTVTARRLV